MDESVEAGARRELKEETGFEASGPVAFIGAYGEPGRDPRGRTISLAHASVIRGIAPDVAGGDDAAEAAWRLAKQGRNLAFDHDAILAKALEWVAQGVRKENLGLHLLPEEFDEAEVKAMFRALFHSTGGASPWLRRMEKAGLIEPRTGSGKLYHAVKNEPKL
jgi:8-oxo-dGTP diphosphatase